MKLHDDDFALFGLPRSFILDAAGLAERWRKLQSEVHPDRFAAKGAAAQRVAMQWSVRVNEAYVRLKDPLRRAAYLCELGGHAVDSGSGTAMPAAFLAQQMHWREALEEAAGADQVTALDDEVAADERAMLSRLAALIDDRNDLAAAAQQVRALMFVARFREDVSRRLASLE